jgi:AcrR family transcriptional regulator
VTSSTTLPDPTEIAEGELAKSRHTRRRILEAGTSCLADYGYKKVSTTMVANRAGLTRAAMLYHFGSRMELVTGIIQHVTRRRIEMYTAAMRELPHDEHFLENAIELAWEQLKTPEFNAFTELSLAARTDPELAAVFRPALAAFDIARRDTGQQLFPEHLANRAEFMLRRDIVRFLLEGIVQQDGISFDRAERIEALLRFLKILVNSGDGERVLQAAARPLEPEPLD